MSITVTHHAAFAARAPIEHNVPQDFPTSLVRKVPLPNHWGGLLSNP